jgi:hypothetical protein
VLLGIHFLFYFTTMSMKINLKLTKAEVEKPKESQIPIHFDAAKKHERKRTQLASSILLNWFFFIFLSFASFEEKNQRKLNNSIHFEKKKKNSCFESCNFSPAAQLYLIDDSDNSIAKNTTLSSEYFHFKKEGNFSSNFCESFFLKFEILKDKIFFACHFHFKATPTHTILLIYNPQRLELNSLTAPITLIRKHFLIVFTHFDWQLKYANHPFHRRTKEVHKIRFQIKPLPNTRHSQHENESNKWKDRNRKKSSPNYLRYFRSN